MNVLLIGDLIQVAAVWIVVVALLTKFPDFIYIYIYILELAKDVCAYICVCVCVYIYIYIHARARLLLIQMFCQTKIINLLILIRYAYTE